MPREGLWRTCWSSGHSCNPHPTPGVDGLWYQLSSAHAPHPAQLLPRRCPERVMQFVFLAQSGAGPSLFLIAQPVRKLFKTVMVSCAFCSSIVCDCFTNIHQITSCVPKGHWIMFHSMGIKTENFRDGFSLQMLCFTYLRCDFLHCAVISGNCCTGKFNVLGSLPISGTKWHEMSPVHTGLPSSTGQMPANGLLETLPGQISFQLISKVSLGGN